MAQKKSNERPEEPLVTMSYQTTSKRSPPFWLLIGARKLVFFWCINSRNFSGFYCRLLSILVSIYKTIGCCYVFSLFFVFCLQVFVFLLHISGSLSVLNQRVLVNMLPDSGWGWRWGGVGLLAADYRFTFPNFSVRLSGSSS